MRLPYIEVFGEDGKPKGTVSLCDEAALVDVVLYRDSHGRERSWTIAELDKLIDALNLMRASASGDLAGE